ncbi:MAG: hypothetical protein AAGF15_06740 [Pseudomonadota bacterium]
MSDATEAKIRDEYELEKIRAEISLLIQDTKKWRLETMFYPFIVGASVAGALLAVGKFFL